MHLTLAFNKNMCYNTTTIKSALGTAPLIARQPAFARCQRLNDGKNRFTAHRTMGFFTASLWNTLGGFFMKQITVKVENQQQLAYLLDILRSKGYKNVQRLSKRYSFPVVVVDLDRKQFFGTNTTCMAALASQGKMCVITVEQLLAQRFFPPHCEAKS